MTAGRRMALLLAGTAALTAATILSAAFAPPGPVLPLASAAYVACVLWAVLARSRHDAAAWRVRLGPIALALALLASLVDRHLVVASRGVAPDDIAAVATSIGCSSRRSVRRASPAIPSPSAPHSRRMR